MDKVVSNFRIPAESLSYSPVYGKGDTCPIDQQPVAKFNIDPATGRPMSDLTAVLRSQGLDRERLLANLEEFRSEFLPDDISDSDALKYQNPRLCQMPSELAEYSEFVTQKRLEEKKKLDDAKEFELFKESLKKKDDDDDSTKQS